MGRADPDQRGIGDIGDLRAAAKRACQGIVVVLQYAHDREPVAVQRDVLADTVGIAEDLGCRRLVQHADERMVVDVDRFQKASDQNRQLLNVRIRRGGAVNGHGRVLGAGFCRDALARGRRDPAELGVVHPVGKVVDRHGVALVVRNADGHHIGAERCDPLLHVAGRAVDQTHQDHQRHNADDDAKHRQKRAHLVAGDRLQCHTNGLNHAPTSVTLPSRIWIERFACVVTFGSCVISTIVFPASCSS